MSSRASDPFAQATTAPGTPLFVEHGPDTFPLVATGLLDARAAAAEVLAAFLRCARFQRDGGDVPSKPFMLERVLAEWPDPTKEVEYPSASIVDAGVQAYEEHSLTPTPMLDTWDSFAPGTVLWKTAEAALRFQVDFWTLDVPTRTAIAARLASLFSPGEGRSGVVLAGDPRYFRRPVRATLLGDHERIDTPDAVFARERRLRVIVGCEVDVVHLRCAVELSPRHKLRPEDPETEE